MNVNAYTWPTNLTLITGSGTMTIAGAQTMNAHDLTLQTDSDLALSANVSGTGALTVRPSAASTTIGVAGGAGTLNLNAADLSHVVDGWSGIAIGRSDGTGAINVNTATWTDPLMLYDGSGPININGAQAMGANAFFARTYGVADITFGASGSVTSSAAGNAIMLASGQNFINNNAGTPLTASAGRWLIYSTSAGSDTPNGLVADNSVYNKTYASYPPASVAETGNVWIYAQYLGTITLTADPKIMTYGGNLPGFTYSFSCSTGCGQGVMSGSPSLTTSATSSSNAGTYSIVASQGAAAANGYQFSFVDETLTIDPAPLTVTADAKSKAYGAANPAMTYQYGGLVNGDTNTVFTGGLSRAAGENVGTYAINQGTLSAGSNYAITYTGNNFAITPAALTVTAADKSKVYGVADPALTYGYAGLVNGDTYAVFSGALTRAVGENAGTYAISQGTLSAGSNYAITYTPGTLTIYATPAKASPGLTVSPYLLDLFAASQPTDHSAKFYPSWPAWTVRCHRLQTKEIYAEAECYTF
jgi:hypothetical protein